MNGQGGDASTGQWAAQSPQWPCRGGETQDIRRSVGSAAGDVDSPSVAYPPLPIVNPMTKFFWDGVQHHRLMILRCQTCGFYIHYPRPVCRQCRSTDLAPAQVSGEATLYSFTIATQAFHPYFVDRLPYTLALVELDEQPALRLTTIIIDCAEQDLKIGMPLHVEWTEVGPGVTLPYFAPGGLVHSQALEDSENR